MELKQLLEESTRRINLDSSQSVGKDKSFQLDSREELFTILVLRCRIAESCHKKGKDGGSVSAQYWPPGTKTQTEYIIALPLIPTLLWVNLEFGGLSLYMTLSLGSFLRIPLSRPVFARCPFESAQNGPFIFEGWRAAENE